MKFSHAEACKESQFWRAAMILYDKHMAPKKSSRRTCAVAIETPVIRVIGVNNPCVGSLHHEGTYEGTYVGICLCRYL